MSSTQEVGDIFGEGRGSAQAMLRSPTVLILCVGLWGMNLFFFRLFGIDYKYVLNLDLIEIEKTEKEKARNGIGSTTTTTNNNNNNSSSSSSSNTKGSGKRGTNATRRDGYSEASTNDYDLEMMETPSSISSSSSSAAAASTKKSSATNRSASGKKNNLLTSIGNNNNNKNSGIEQGPLSSPPSLSSQQIFPTTDASQGWSILWHKLVMFSAILLFLLHVSTHYWMDHLEKSSIGAVFFFYTTVAVYVLVPLRRNAWLRRSLRIVVQRAWALVRPRCSCISLAGTSIPPRRIPFVDVFFADAMCSLSKVFFDWGMLAHQAAHYPYPVPASAHNIVIPSMCAALPYLIRARQCLVMFSVGRLKRCPKKHEHLMNAFKYSTSMYPLILSAYLKTLSEDDDGTTTSRGGLEKLLFFLMVINASYSLYWDIVMDWGMMQDPYRVAQTACAMGIPSMALSEAGGTDGSGSAQTFFRQKGKRNTTCHRICLRPHLRYGLTLTVLIVTADSFLRFSWLLKFVPRLFRSNDAFVLCTQFLEVFRRAIWNLLRVEWEDIKQQKSQSGGQYHRSGSGSKDSLSDADPRELQQLELQHGGVGLGLGLGLGNASSSSSSVVLSSSPQKQKSVLGIGTIIDSEDPPGSILELKTIR